MANSKEIKRRIKSIQNTGKITKAMELISTVKMKKSQDLALEKKAYITGLLQVFAHLEETLEESIFFQKPEKATKTLGVIIVSNKGLCGGYNINVMKQVHAYMKEHDEKIDFITLGKRGAAFVSKTGNELIADFSGEFGDQIEARFTRSVSRLIQEKFATGEYGKVKIFYNHYVNTIKQIPLQRTFLPLKKADIDEYFQQVLGEDFESHSEKKHDFLIEPSVDILLQEVLPMLLDAMFHDMCLEAKASEHSARMIAMKNAKENAYKYASKLTLSYNKARQAGITTEVSEIVS